MKIKIEINYHVDNDTFDEVLQETGLDEERLKIILQETYLEQIRKQNIGRFQAELSIKFEEDRNEFDDIQVGYA